VRATFEADGAMIAGHHLGATVSIGAADCLAKGCNIGRLLSRADAALYASKQSGRNRVTCAPEDDAPVTNVEQPAGDVAAAAGLLHAA
jgi:predicted signal transduction protein with EAL and GGDEF domain